jgi:hypothetical protein
MTRMWNTRNTYRDIIRKPSTRWLLASIRQRFQNSVMVHCRKITSTCHNERVVATLVVRKKHNEDENIRLVAY